VRFEVSWTAPAAPTGVQFHVWAVSANDDDRSNGDGASEAIYSLVSGCEGEMYFRDADRDGYGSTFGTRLDCADRDGYSKTDDDCNDNDERINPGVTEYCNERDDDCDGTTDEGSVPIEHYPDADGDDHGARRSESVLECPPPAGYAPSDDDCDDTNSSAYPGAIEICDGTDNDCDARVDERVRPQCGVGWCVRDSFTCDIQDCEPGEPSPEKCNYLDDDCDDALDEEVTDCAPNEVCREGACVAASSVAGQDGPTPAEAAPDAQVAMNAGTGSAGSMGSMGPTGSMGEGPPTASNTGGCSVLRAQAAPRPIASAVLCVLALWLVRRSRGAKLVPCSRR
jgi:hypothetical protein